jgi:transposase
MRKSINGLLTIVEQELGLSPFAPRLFVFCNRQRDKIKIFHWERSGFVLWYKRLEKARFPCPRRDKDGVGRSSSCRGSGSAPGIRKGAVGKIGVRTQFPPCRFQICDRPNSEIPMNPRTSIV